MADPADTPPRPIPFWMPDTQGFLAIAIVVLMTVITIILLVHPPAVDEKTAQLLSIILGILIGCFKDVYNFFFSSSSGSKEKDKVAADMQVKGAETLATAVAAVAASTPATPSSTTTVTTTEPASPGRLATQTTTTKSEPPTQPEPIPVTVVGQPVDVQVIDHIAPTGSSSSMNPERQP